MFFKEIKKKDRHGIVKYVHYRLCESYRISDKIRHRNILTISNIGDLNILERKQLADRIEQITYGQQGLFFLESLKIEELAQKYAKQLIHRNKVIQNCQISENPKLNQNKPVNDWQTVDLNTLENSDAKEIGSEWICKQILDKLQVSEILQELGFTSWEIILAYIQWISRTVKPDSELATVAWLNRSTGLCELFGLGQKPISRFHLYNISRKLYKHKSHIENQLYNKISNELKIQDTIILYDLTNSYFEGRMLQSQKAKHGRSKEKRKDCKLISLALVINQEGVIKYSQIYDGNISEPKTLEKTLADIQNKSNLFISKPIIVMDAGIATEDNLSLLSSKEYNYVCVSRCKIKDYIYSGETKIVYDRNDDEIKVTPIYQDKKTDNFIQIISKNKKEKEDSINDKIGNFFEIGLKNIQNSLHKKRGIKTIAQIHERIGKLKAKYPKVSSQYEINTEHVNDIITKLDWNRKPTTEKQEGIYFLRTTLDTSDSSAIWEIFNTLREIESTFRCLKTELIIRPNYHQTDENIEPHIFMGLLAYQIVNVIRFQLITKNKQNDCWNTLLEKMNTQKLVTSSITNNENKRIHIRACTIPSVELKQIHDVLKLQPVPFYQKKMS